jgi:hypothetical protein
MRLKQHINKALSNCTNGACPKLYNAIRKYGAENFEIKEIEKCLSRKELNKKEDYWINTLNSIEVGYNLCGGGNFGKLSKEAREKISKSKIGNTARKGMKNSKKHREMHSKRMKENNPAKGKPAINRRKIKCLENDTIYNSIREASEKLGVQKSNMSKHLKNERKHVNGYTFIEII